MPGYRRYYIPAHPIFLTIVTHNRRPWLADDGCVETVLQSMHWAKTKHLFLHLAHAILPDHLHWMLLPGDTTSYPDLVAAMKRDATWRLKVDGLS